MPRETYRPFELIAIHAGLVCGLKLPTVAQAAELPQSELNHYCELVADDDKAAALRDQLTLEFEARLRDSGYTGDQVTAWFRQAYGPVSRTAIYRARADARAAISRIEENAAEARAFVDLAREQGCDAVFAGGSERFGQLAFQLLMTVNPENLAGKNGKKLTFNRIVALAGAIAKLQKSRSDVDLAAQRIAEIQRKFDDQIKAASKKPGGSVEFTPEMIEKVRKAVFG